MADFEIPRYIQDAVDEDLESLGISRGSQTATWCLFSVNAALIAKQKHDATNEVVGKVRKDLLCAKCGELAKLLEECADQVGINGYLLDRIEAALEPWRITESEVK